MADKAMCIFVIEMYYRTLIVMLTKVGKVMIGYLLGEGTINHLIM